VRTDLLFAALGIVALATYLAPVVTTLQDFPGVLDVAKLFEPSIRATPMKRFTFTAANGKTPLNLDFYPPTDAGPSPAPWVLVIHGGGWINGSSDQLPELNYHLARKGYAVISIDYRLSPGWLWPAPKDDAFDALKFIRAKASEFAIDPDRWAILGRSAGAQIAGVVAYSLHGDQRPKGFISFYNPTDLIFGYGVGKEDDILRSRTLLRGFLGGTPDEAKALYESASVMGAVTADACPTLLIHGLKDTIVWEKHSERLHEVLKKNGVDDELVLLRFGPHGFDFFFNGPEAQVATAKVDGFLKRVLPVKELR
jgi:acetyl esterase/lipase